MPLTAITAWEAFFDRLKVQPDKSMLIIGGAGGVGSIGIQFAKMARLTVIATASRQESAAWAETMGAAHAADRSEEHTSELQSLTKIVCRLLLEKKKKKKKQDDITDIVAYQ